MCIPQQVGEWLLAVARCNQSQRGCCTKNLTVRALLTGRLLWLTLVCMEEANFLQILAIYSSSYSETGKSVMQSRNGEDSDSSVGCVALFIYLQTVDCNCFVGKLGLSVQPTDDHDNLLATKSKEILQCSTSLRLNSS